MVKGLCHVKFCTDTHMLRSDVLGVNGRDLVNSQEAYIKFQTKLKKTKKKQNTPE